MQFYAEDFLNGTRYMTNAEVGLYIRLLAEQVDKGSVPDDVEHFAKAFGKECRKLWPTVRAKFVEGPTHGTLVNERMSVAIAARDAYREKQAAKGRASAASRSGSSVVQPELTRGSTVVEPLGDGENTSSGNERAQEAVTWPAWAGPKTQSKWGEYLVYRLKQHRFRYKAIGTQQQAINELTRWFPDGPRFVAAMDHTMVKGWKYPVDPAEYKYPAVEGAPTKKHNPRA